MINICVFASGEGSNFQNLVSHFNNSTLAKVSILISNKLDCGAVKISKVFNIKHLIITEDNSDYIVEELVSCKIDLIILAGYLKKIPKQLIDKFKIVNIHPSLLPKFGGKGMYGMNVHKSVIDSGESESGITIHFVNEEFDKGEVISQYKCNVSKEDTPESLSIKVRNLESKYFPVEIEMLIHRLDLINGKI